ncbi:MAG TPA: glycosyltransferase family 2 protein [Candidatus Krumholzibacteria bacterium]|nr:glycosyltransferase family 2 protein [Candidatus Krumholzibacteria bacterium]
MELVFLVSALVVSYAYVLYPVIVVAWSRLFHRRVEKRYRQIPVSVVIAARNEEKNISARIENLLAQEYPRDLLEIIIVTDGCSDRTAELARLHAGPGLQVLECATPVGKATALNIGVAAATRDIVVFADARQSFSPNAIAELVSVFHDAAVGAVSGELILVQGAEIGEVHEGVGLYWQYEKLIRRSESAIASVVGATGSIYAVRRELYVPLAPNTLLDDFLVPMRIVLAGYRVVFLRAARAFDFSSATTSREFSRKVRTLAGNFQAVAMEPRLLDPRANPVLFQFVSHKLLRLVVPYFCLIAWVSSALIDKPVYRALFVAQTLFYAIGLLNLTPLKPTRVTALVRVSWTFMVMNAAAVAGLWMYLTREEHEIWRKT